MHLESIFVVDLGWYLVYLEPDFDAEFNVCHLFRQYILRIFFKLLFKSCLNKVSSWSVGEMLKQGR